MDTTTALEQAKAAHAAAVQRTEAARAAIKDAYIAEAEAQNAQAAAYLAVLHAQAAADGSVYPVGTRVRHRHFDVEGTVVPNDGTGLAIRQDGAEEATYGFAASEWVAL